MEILKCNAEFDKVYYIVFSNALRECKFIKTIGNGNDIPLYVLDIANIGIVNIQALRQQEFHSWYYKSKIKSVLYESIADYQNNKPIIDDYGSTSNCYNSNFIRPLFKFHRPCNCGGSTYTWKWNGYKADQYITSLHNVEWSWDKNGFHCSLNEQIGCYKSEQECINNNQISVITF